MYQEKEVSKIASTSFTLYGAREKTKFQCQNYVGQPTMGLYDLQ